MRQVGYYTGTPGESLSAAPLAAAPTRAPARCRQRRRRRLQPVGVADLQVLRQQLAAASLRLHTMLDGNWRNYLAMPPEIYAGDRPRQCCTAFSRRWPTLMPWPAIRSMPFWPSGRSSAPRTSG